MKRILFGIFLLCLIPAVAEAQDPKITEDWSSKPEKIEPGKKTAPPSDATILFRKGSDIQNWMRNNGEPAKWKLGCRKMIANKTGDIITREPFGDCQLHVEWKSPGNEKDLEGQGKGNSGVYLMGLYEVQVLDSYENETYYNGQAGSIYKQSPPLVNACRKPGKWQTYDIVFKAPRFAEDGALLSPAYLTVFHNGVLIQNNFELKGKTVYAGFPSYKVHDEKLPLLLQDHGNPVQYRNIWIREL